MTSEKKERKEEKSKRFDATTYKKEYAASHYDRLELRVLKGQKDIIKEIASISGMSVNCFIVEAIKEKIVRDGFMDYIE